MEKEREGEDGVVEILASLFRGRRHVIGVWTRHFLHHNNHQSSLSATAVPNCIPTIPDISSFDTHRPHLPPSPIQPTKNFLPLPLYIGNFETAFEKSLLCYHIISYTLQHQTSFFLSFVICLSIYLSIRVAFSRLFQNLPKKFGSSWEFWLLVCYCAGSDLI